jgi:hypothetical protein
VRRIVATLLVVASPLLLAHPVSASEDQLRPSGAHPAVAPSAPAPVQGLTSAVPLPAPAAAVEAPALPAPAAAPALTRPVPPPVRHAARAVRAKTPASASDLNDAAYTAKLQAELCQARAIFCGLDRNGRYPGH